MVDREILLSENPMVFNAQLPTFHNTFSSWVFNVGTGAYVALHADADCQFYIGKWKMPVQVWTQYRGQREPDLEKDQGHIYPLLLTPIDLVDVEQLDPFAETHIHPPVVEVDTPPLGAKLYKVVQTEVRWAGFPNEHIASVLIPVKAGDDPRELVPPDPPEDGGLLEVAGMVNDGCSDCEDLNGTITCDQEITPTRWDSLPFVWGCRTGECAWSFQLVGVTGAILFIVDYDTIPFAIMEWSVDLTGWNGTDPITLTCTVAPPEDPEGYCTWPETLTFTPA